MLGLACRLLLITLALQCSAAMAQGGIIAAVRTWVPPTGQDRLDAARDALTRAPVQTTGSTFSVAPEEPTWYALDIVAGETAETGMPGDPLVLELTHPSLRSARLHTPAQPGIPERETRSGRDVPAQQRAGTRFPATLELPAVVAAAGQQTVYLRVFSAVPAHGSFLLQPKSAWTRMAMWTHAVQGLCFGLAALAALYALARAIRLRSAAYGIYFLVACSIGLAGMFISGFGDTWLWPALAAWRGQMASAMACMAAGLVLLLARRAFALEVRAPAWSRMLLILGLGCPAVGLAGLMLDLSTQQRLSHAAAAVATLMGLASVFLAWRTANRVALWLLLGFTPVVVGVGATTLAVAGVIPFMPWVLLAMPLASALEVPFNLRGLYLLECRRALVMNHRARVARQAGPPGETRLALAERLDRAGAETRAAPATVMLLRFEGLAPGSASLLAMDSVNVERYLNSMMELIVHAGNLAGRWSFHELVLHRVHLKSASGVGGLVTALFAQALRGESVGIPSGRTRLRIAYGRLEGAGMTIEEAIGRLAAALDEPANAALRKLELDLASQLVIVPLLPVRRAVSSPI